MILDKVLVELLVVEKLGVEREGTRWDESRQEDNAGENGEVNGTDVEEGVGGIGLLNLLVNVLTERWREDGVDGDVGHVEEGHNGSEGGDTGCLGFNAGEGRLDVGREGNVTSCPTVGDGDERGGHLPSNGNLVRCRVVVWEVPHDEEEESIEADEWDGGWDPVSEEEDGHGTQKFTEVGTCASIVSWVCWP